MSTVDNTMDDRLVVAKFSAKTGVMGQSFRVKYPHFWRYPNLLITPFRISGRKHLVREFFYKPEPFLPPNQQRQSAQGTAVKKL